MLKALLCSGFSYSQSLSPFTSIDIFHSDINYGVPKSCWMLICRRISEELCGFVSHVFGLDTGTCLEAHTVLRRQCATGGCMSDTYPRWTLPTCVRHLSWHVIFLISTILQLEAISTLQRCLCPLGLYLLVVIELIILYL